MSRWFRHYAGLTADPKFGGIARRSKATKERVVFVWCCLLESAADANDGGAYSIDADSMADLLSCETGDIEAILQQFEAVGLIGAGRIAKWADRQFESDTSASRTRRYRERKRLGDGDVTSQAVTVTPPETETETDTELPVEPPESHSEKPEPDIGAAAPRTARGGKAYSFESGVIRLTEADFRKFEQAFPNLGGDLQSELMGLAGWAGEQPNWFFAVQGALAKRNREARLASERVRVEAHAAANAPPKPKIAYLGP